MRKILTQVLCGLVLVLALGAVEACYGPYVSGGAGIEVGVAPPPFRAEVAIAAPGPEFVWVPGFWDWGGQQWVWVSGVWQRPPQPRAHWVRPHYQQRRGHWVYIRGHWS